MQVLLCPAGSTYIDIYRYRRRPCFQQLAGRRHTETRSKLTVFPSFTLTSGEIAESSRLRHRYTDKPPTTYLTALPTTNSNTVWFDGGGLEASLSTPRQTCNIKGGPVDVDKHLDTRALTCLGNYPRVSDYICLTRLSAASCIFFFSSENAARHHDDLSQKDGPRMVMEESRQKKPAARVPGVWRGPRFHLYK